jgi:hypothetical protein
MLSKLKPNDERQVWIKRKLFILEWDDSKQMWRSELLGTWDGKEDFMTFWLSEDAVNDLCGGVPF